MEYQTESYGYICQIPDFAREQLFYASGMGCIQNDPAFRIDRRDFPWYLIMFCVSGKLYIEQYQTSTTLLPGQCCLMNLEDSHVYYSDSEDPCELLWIDFNGKHAKDLILSIFDNSPKYRIIENRSVFSLLKNCISNYESDSVGACFANSANIYQILLLFLEKTLRSGAKESSFLSPLTKQLDPFLSNHINEKITLPMMAEQCHLNPSYFCRRFRSETNLTPMQYLMQKRIELAKYSLLYTQNPMSQIAENLGFYNQNHFSFCFLKAVGISPTQYRRQNRKETNTYEILQGSQSRRVYPIKKEK